MTVPSSEPKKTRRPRITKADYELFSQGLRMLQAKEEETVVERALQVFKHFDGGDYADLLTYCDENDVSVGGTETLDAIEAALKKLDAYR